MVAAIKEICIFVIIAQAIMFFVPGNSYMKYVRVLVGIMMILKITEPIFGLFLDEEKEREIEERILLLEQNIDLNSNGLELEDNSMGIYESIEEELKVRLNECECGYEILDVALTEDRKMTVTLGSKKNEQNEMGVIRVEPVVAGTRTAKEREPGAEEEEKLKEIFESCIGVDAERIELIFN